MVQKMARLNTKEQGSSSLEARINEYSWRAFNCLFLAAYSDAATSLYNFKLAAEHSYYSVEQNALIASLMSKMGNAGLFASAVAEVAVFTALLSQTKGVFR